MSEIKAGDVVELKSGSDPMTVVSVNKSDRSGEVSAHCIWKPNNQDALMEKDIPVQALVKKQ